MFALIITMQAFAEGKPTVSTPENEVWYLIQFMNDGNALTAESDGTQITISPATTDDSRLWKVTGDDTEGYTFTNKKGEKVVIDYKDNIIQKATKYFPDGTVAHVKTYITDDSGKRIITTLKPNDDGSLSIAKIAEHTKETTIQYEGENGFISKYIRRFGDTWKDLTPFISQEKVPVPRTTALYLQDGMNINRFLRSGEFYNNGFRSKRIPMEIPDDNFRAYTESLVKKAKELNRQIIDSIDNLDIATHSSRTTKPMVVYRDAPIAWLDTAKDGKLIDRGYCSTSTERGASMEGMLSKEPTMTYEIELDENMPFLDLTHTSEKEMLLPRNLEFQIIGPNRLKCLGPISE